MFLKMILKETTYTRPSKHGINHNYVRKKTVALLRCDNCDTTFERDLKHIQRKRLSNNYFHCCSSCDSKKFAQRKGVERKTIWDLPAGIDLPVGKF
jgi:hypothetical protein